nr:RNA polymerase sigma factor [uncultured Oscillibacter sp.]
MLTICLAMLETEADRQKFTRLYEAMEKKVYAVALRVLGNPDQAEDAAQHAWLRMIQRWEVVSALSWDRAGGYAVTAAKNAALDLMRLQSRTAPLPEDWDPPAPAGGGDGYQYLVSLVRQLPEGYRRVLELKLVEELTNREIAQRLRIRESTVSSRVMRGRAMLQKRLREEGICDA